jgi:hypothetical protein
MRMPSFQNPERRARIRTGIGFLLSLFLVITSILTIITVRHTTAQAANSQLLPGQQIWQQGASSLLFGANDSNWQWSNNNLGNSPAISTAVRNAGITVIRSPLHATDAQARVSAIEATGAKCLGILSPADAAQVVKMLGDRCDMYEWRNEPDNGGPTASEYATSWNQNIPSLRSINPNAIFIGPVVASPNLPYIQQFLTLAKQAGNIPDVVSYHAYICTDTSIAACPSHIPSYISDAAQVRATVRSVLGYDLPLALTEWNFSWKPGQTPQADPFMKTFATLSLQAMMQAGLVMANEYDIASNAGNGTLDLINPQSGQIQPELTGMQQMIQQYQIQQAPPAPPAPPKQLPQVQTTQPPTHVQPTNQPPPLIVVGMPADKGSFVVGQQLHCEPGTPLNSQLAIANQPADTNLLSNVSITQDGCSLVFKVQNSQQILRFNWWNQGTAITNALSFLVSSDSTNGVDGTWKNFPATSFIAAGGSQTVPLQGETWVKVSVNPPASNAPAANLTMELYAIDTPPATTNPIAPPSQPITLPAQPITLPRN